MKASRLAAVEIVLGLLVLMLLPGTLQAQFPPTQDAYIDKLNGTNYGTNVNLIVDNPNYETFIQFDLSGLPPGTTGSSVGKATLVLYASAVGSAGSFNIYEVDSAWNELTISGTKEPTLGNLIVSDAPVTIADKNNFVIIDVTQAVKDWLNGTVINNGLALETNGTAVNVTFNSKENTATSHNPQLNVEFIPTGGTITGVTASTGLVGGGTSGNVTLAVDSTQVPFLSYPNTFTANQTVSGSVTATSFSGNGSGLTNVNAALLNGLASSAFQPAGSYAVTTGPNTFNGTQTISSGDVAISAGNFDLPATSGSGAGVITVGGAPFVHAYPPGYYNTFVGQSAGNFTMTGFSNTANGYWALQSNTTGWQNTATGRSALRLNTTGYNNTASGFEALYSNSSGGGNTASGATALTFNTTGSANTASGYEALGVNSTGSNNTAIGLGALGSNTTGSYNTGVGVSADVGSNNLTNAAAIGACATVGASNALVLGAVAGACSGAITANTNVGIGTSAPAYTLDVNGTGNFTGLVNFASGQTFPGTGTVTSVGSGAGLTGGPITSSGTLSIATGGVTNAMLQNSSLTVSAGSGLVGGGSVSLGGGIALALNPNISAATGAFSAGGSPVVSATNTANGAYGQLGTTIYSAGAGVYGSGTYGVFGASGNGTGVTGTGFYGVYGSGTYAVLGLAGGGSTYGVYGSGSSYGVYSYGNFAATGSKSAVVALPDDRVVSLYTVESPENWFEDFGFGQLTDGRASIELDPTFALTVSPEAGYHVFLTPKGDCEGLYVTNETATGFEVRELHKGTSNVAFDYRIVAKRKGLESLRLEQVSSDHDTAESIRKQIADRPSHPPKLVLPKAVPPPLELPKAP